MKKSILLIHGFNNTVESFLPLANLLKTYQYNVILIGLPGHQENRSELENMSIFLKTLDERIKLATKEEQEYYLVAFSAGALFFSIWLRDHPHLAPKRQIFLAPAFCIKKHRMIELMTRFLPSKMKIPGQTPKPFRRFDYLLIKEYRLLLEGIAIFQKQKMIKNIPSLIMVDPKDELINIKEISSLENSWTQIIYIKRSYLRWKKLGKHHMLFDPAYFSQSDWRQLGEKINDFLK